MAADRGPKNPFVGPRPFDWAHRSFFFGREGEVSELVSLVISSPVVLLYAPSGAGKSSLINAALVPELERSEGFEVFPIARVRGPVADERVLGPAADEPAPGGVGNIYVSSVISNWLKEPGNRKVRRAAPGRLGTPGRQAGGATRTGASRPLSAEASLQDFLKERRHAIGPDGEKAPRVIIFDQFEEIITAYPEHWRDREGFFEQIFEALKADDLLRVVFSVREDFVGTLNPFAPLLPDGFRTQFRLERLSPEAALEAIEGPVSRTSRSFAPNVAENLVSDLRQFRVDTGFGERIPVEGEFVEPVQLQVVCRTLWSELDPAVTEITEEHRRSYGNVDRALSRFYTKAIAAAAQRGGIDESALRRWFEKFFITSMNTRGTVYRTPGSTAGMTNIVIDELESRHLIHAEWRARARWYELSHDRLIEPILSSNYDFLIGPSSPEEDLVLKASFTLARAESARSEGRSDEALKASEEALEMSQRAGDVAGQATGLMKLSEIYFEQGSLDQALELVEGARAVYEGREDEVGLAEALRGIGQIQRARGQLDLAREHFDRSLEISLQRNDPVSATRTLVAVLDMLMSDGRYDDAREHAQIGLDLAVKTDNEILTANMLDYLGLVEYHAGSEEAARELWSNACRRYDALGDSVGAALMLENIGHLDLGRGDVESALGHYERAVYLYEEAQETAAAAQVLNAMAEANWYSGHLREALEVFDHAVILEPDSATIRNGRGQVLAHLGRYEDALNELDTALDLAGTEQPLAAYVHSARGLALGGLGKHQEALAELQRALDDAPHNAWAYLNRALVHELSGDTSKASEDLERALRESDPPLPAPLRELAESHLASVATK